MNASQDPIRQLRIVHGALLGGCAMFAGVVAFVTASNTEPPPQGLEALQWVGVLVAVVSIVPAIVLRSMLAKRAAAPAATPATREAIARLALMPAAVLEGAVLLNLVAWMVTDSQWPNAVAALLPFLASLGMWIAGPGIGSKGSMPG